MNSQRVLGLCLVALQATMIAFLSGASVLPFVACVLAALGTFTRWRFTLRPDRAVVLTAVGALVFVIKSQFAPHEFPSSRLFIRTQVAHEFAVFLLLVQGVTFFVRRPHDRLPTIFPVIGAVVVVFAGDVQVTTEQRPITNVMSISYVLLWCLYLCACKQHSTLDESAERPRSKRSATGRSLATGAMLAAVAATAWLSSGVLYDFERRIEGWLFGLFATSRSDSAVGFSRHSQLGSLLHRKSASEDEIALRVYSANRPPYLRGRVFTHFSGSSWESPPSIVDAVGPTGMAPAALRSNHEDDNVFSHRDFVVEEVRQWQRYECWRDASLNRLAFTPLGATHLRAATNDIRPMPYGLFELRTLPPGEPYTTAVPKPAAKLLEHKVRGAVFDELRGKPLRNLTSYAQPIFAGCDTDAEKIAAVERHFRQNYKYHLGIEIPPGEDPLLYFLRERPPAHCEYFATAATLLLRHEGVKARYVTGFVVAERNEVGGYWVARNKHAHAWAEAYDADRGWVTVEATPSVGVPRLEATTSGWTQWWENLRAQVRRLRVYVSQKRWPEVRRMLGKAAVSLPGIVILTLIAFWLTVRLTPWRWFRRRRSAVKLSARDSAFRQVLATMDARLLRHELKRFDSETLSDFAERVGKTGRIAEPKHVAEWYRRYASYRYGGGPDGEKLQDLAATMPEVQAATGETAPA